MPYIIPMSLAQMSHKLVPHFRGREFAARWKEAFRLEPLYRRWGTRLIRRLYHPHYIGFHRLPESGPAILVANHVSYLDGVILSAGCARPMRFVIDQEIYDLPIVHHFMTVNRAIPVLATRGSVAAMLEQVEQALAAGDLVCIFPEGQLTYTGSLSRFRPGIEWIIHRAQVPVYPIAIKGLWGSLLSRKHRGFWRKLRHWRRGMPITALCGEAIPAAEVTANRLQQEVLRLKYKI